MKLTRAPEAKGSPHTFIIASAGLRAADLTRALRKFQTKEAMVAKLFAKHIKLRDAVEMVKKTRMNIGVGTPQRLSDLLEDGVYYLEDSERRIADVMLSQDHYPRLLLNGSSSMHRTSIRRREASWT